MNSSEQGCQYGQCPVRSVVGELQGPFLGCLDGCLLISLPCIGDLLIQGIVQVGQRHQGLDGEEHRSDLESWWPLVLEDVEANSAEFVDVWVVDLSSEEDLGWDHWVLLRQEERAGENTAFVRSFSWSGNLEEEMSWVLLIWLGVNSNNWILCKSLSFLSATINQS